MWKLGVLLEDLYISIPMSRSPSCDGFGLVLGIDRNRLYDSFPGCTTQVRVAIGQIAYSNLENASNDDELTARK